MRMEKNEVCSKVATLKMGTKIEQRFFFFLGFFGGSLKEEQENVEEGDEDAL